MKIYIFILVIINLVLINAELKIFPVTNNLKDEVSSMKVINRELFALGHNNGYINLLNLTSGEFIKCISGKKNNQNTRERHYGRINSLEMLPDGSALVSSSDALNDASTRFWNITTTGDSFINAYTIESYGFKLNNLKSLKLLKDGILINLNNEGNYHYIIHLWNTPNYTLVNRTLQTKSAINWTDLISYEDISYFINLKKDPSNFRAIATHLNYGNFVYEKISFLGDDSNFFKNDLNYKKCYHNNSFIISLIELKDRKLVSGHECGEINLWNRNSHSKITIESLGITDNWRLVSLLKLNDSTLVACYKNGTIIFWNIVSGKIIQRLNSLASHLCIIQLYENTLFFANFNNVFSVDVSDYISHSDSDDYEYSDDK